MLRGRCSCAISGRPRPSPALKSPLSPIIPVHPGNSPVSPIIPVHTQKQGGGALKQLSATSNQRLGGKNKAGLIHLSNPGGSNRLENSAPICRLSTEHPTRMLILSEPGESKDHSSSDSATLNCKPAFLTPAFTTTSIAIVGAPTIVPLLTAKGKPKKKRALAAASGPYNGERNPRAQALRGSPRRSGQAG